MFNWFWTIFSLGAPADKTQNKAQNKFIAFNFVQCKSLVTQIKIDFKKLRNVYSIAKELLPVAAQTKR